VYISSSLANNFENAYPFSHHCIFVNSAKRLGASLFGHHVICVASVHAQSMPTCRITVTKLIYIHVSSRTF